MAVLKYYVEGKGYIDLGANEVARFKQLYPTAQRVTPEPQPKPEQPKPEQPKLSGKPLMYDVLMKETDPLKRVEATLMSQEQLTGRQAMLGEAKKLAEPSLAKILTPEKAGYKKGQAIARKLDNWEDALTIDSDNPVAKFVNEFTGAMTDTIAGLATSVASVPGLSVTSPVLEMIGNPYGSQMIKGMVDKAYELHGYGAEDMDIMGALGDMDLPKAAGIGFKAFVQSAPQTAAWVMNPYLGMGAAFATSGTGKYLDMEREHPELGKGAAIEAGVVVGTMEALSEHIGNVFGLGKTLRLGKNLPAAAMKKVLKRELGKRTYMGIAKQWGIEAGIEGIEEMPNFAAEYLMDIHNGIAEWDPQVFRDGMLNAGLLGAAAGGWQGGIGAGRNVLLYNRYLNIGKKVEAAANTDVTKIRDIEKRNIAANIKDFAQKTQQAAQMAMNGNAEGATEIAKEVKRNIVMMKMEGKTNKVLDTLGLYNSLILDSIDSVQAEQAPAEQAAPTPAPIVERTPMTEVVEDKPSIGMADVNTAITEAMQSRSPEAIDNAKTMIDTMLPTALDADKQQLNTWKSVVSKLKPVSANTAPTETKPAPSAETAETPKAEEKVESKYANTPYKELQTKAKELGINTFGVKKAALISQIDAKEAETDRQLKEFKDQQDKFAALAPVISETVNSVKDVDDPEQLGTAITKLRELRKDADSGSRTIIDKHIQKLTARKEKWSINDLAEKKTKQSLSMPAGNANETIDRRPIEETGAIPKERIGKKAVVSKEDNEMEVQYALVDIDDVIVSQDIDTFKDNPEYPKELQNRDRSEQKASTLEKAAKLKPYMLGEAAVASDGRPIGFIDTNGRIVVIAGNERTMAIKMRHRGDYGGLSEYEDYLKENLSKFGIADQDTKGRMLIALYNGEENIVSMAKLLNQVEQKQMDAVETAKSDAIEIANAKKHGNDIVDLLDTNTKGLMTEANKPFIDAFIELNIPKTGIDLYYKDGQYTEDLRTRIENALFMYIFSNSKKAEVLLSNMRVIGDSSVKNLLKGIMDNSKQIAKLRNLIEKHNLVDLDITQDLIDAVYEINRMKAEGVSISQALYEQDLFSVDQALVPEDKMALYKVIAGITSQQQAYEFIAEYYATAFMALDPEQYSLWSKETNKEEFLNEKANEWLERKTKKDTGTNPKGNKASERDAGKQAPPSKAEVKPPAPAPEAPKLTSSATFKQQWRDAQKGKLTEEELDAQMVVLDAFMETMAAELKMSVDDLYSTYLGDVTNKGKPDELARLKAEKGIIRGYIRLLNGKASFTFLDPDITTGFHEMAHLGQEFIKILAKNDSTGKWQNLLNDAETYCGVKDGVWTKEADEKFAVSFERYMYDGVAPTSKLKTVFEKVRGWIAKLLDRVKTLEGYNLSPEIINVYNVMLGGEYVAPKAEARTEVKGMDRIVTPKPSIPSEFRELNGEEQGGAFTGQLKKGDTFTIGDNEYTVTVDGNKFMRIKSSKGKTYTIKKYYRKDGTVGMYSGGDSKNDQVENFFRDVEGQISLDLINENNPFHKMSFVTKTAIAGYESQKSTLPKPALTSEQKKQSVLLKANLKQEQSVDPAQLETQLDKIANAKGLILKAKKTGANIAFYITDPDGATLIEVHNEQDGYNINGFHDYNNGDAIARVNDLLGQVKGQVSGFHGSGAFFDRFDFNFIGTGEGRQAFGWGAYVTEPEMVGRNYADNVGRRGRPEFIPAKDIYYSLNLPDTSLAAAMRKRFVNEYMNYGNANDSLVEVMRFLDTIKYNGANSATEPNFYYASNQELIEDIDRLKAEINISTFLKTEGEKGRHLYRVNVWEDRTEDVLDWFGDITPEQEQKIITQALKENVDIVVETYEGMEEADDYLTSEQIDEYIKDNKLKPIYHIHYDTGETLYTEIQHELGSPKAASEFLLRAGIDGIKYPVNATSGGKGEKGYNYVVFDADAINIQDHIRFQVAEQSEAERQMAAVRAKYEGTDKWMKAPNGKPSNLNERQWLQVRTPNFIAWFGDWLNDPKNASKVVDENGEPMVVYHGTEIAFTATDEAEFYGGWWSDNPKVTSEFGNNTYSAFMNMRNPFEINEEDRAEEAYQALADEYVDRRQDELIAAGYDGVMVWDETNLVTGMSYIPFSPTQIKSATGNVGTFDAKNPDIRYQAVKDANAAQAKKHNAILKAYEKLRIRLKENGKNIQNWNSILTYAVNRSLRIQNSRAVPYDPVKAAMLFDFDLMPPTEAELKRTSDIDGAKQMQQLLEMRKAKHRRMIKNDQIYKDLLKKITGFDDISKVPTINLFAALEKLDETAYKAMISDGTVMLLRETIPALAEMREFADTAYTDDLLYQIGAAIINGSIAAFTKSAIQSHRLLIRALGKVGVNVVQLATKGERVHSEITHHIADPLKKLHDKLNTAKNARKARYTGEECKQMMEIIYDVQDDVEITDKQAEIKKRIAAKNPNINTDDVIYLYDTALEVMDYFKDLIEIFNADPNHTRKIGIRENYLPRIYRLGYGHELSAPSEGYLHWTGNTQERTAEKADPSKMDVNLYKIIRSYSYQMAKVLSYADLAAYVEKRSKVIGMSVDKKGEEHPIYKEKMSPLTEQLDLATANVAATNDMQKYVESYVKAVIGYGDPKGTIDRVISGVKNNAYVALLAYNMRLTLQNYMQKLLIYTAVDGDVANAAVKHVNAITGRIRGKEDTPLLQQIMRGYVIHNRNLISETTAEQRYNAEAAQSKAGKMLADLSYLNGKLLSHSPFQYAESGNRGWGHAAGVLQVVMRTAEYKQAIAAKKSWAQAVEAALANPEIYKAAETMGAAVNAEINADADVALAPALYQKGIGKYLTFVRYGHTFLQLMHRVYMPKSMRSEWNEDLYRLNMSGNAGAITQAEKLRAVQIAVKWTSPTMIKELLNQAKITEGKADIRLSKAEMLRVHKYFNELLSEYTTEAQKNYPDIARGMKGKAQRMAGLTTFIAQDAILNTLYVLLQNMLWGLWDRDEEDEDVSANFLKYLWDATQLARLTRGYSIMAGMFPNLTYANTPEEWLKAWTSWGVRITPGLGVIDNLYKQARKKTMTDELYDILLDQ